MTTAEHSSDAQAPRRELLLVLILAGVQFSHIMDFVIMMPLGPQLMRVFGIAPKHFKCERKLFSRRTVYGPI